MVLGKLTVPGASYYSEDSRARPTAIIVGAGCLDLFSLICHFFPFFSLSLGDGPI